MTSINWGPKPLKPENTLCTHATGLFVEDAGWACCRARCLTCSLIGPAAENPTVAVQLFWLRHPKKVGETAMSVCPHLHVFTRKAPFRDLAYEAVCSMCNLVGPPSFDHTGAEVNFRIMEKRRRDQELYNWVNNRLDRMRGIPHEDIRDQSYTETKEYITLTEAKKRYPSSPVFGAPYGAAGTTFKSEDPYADLAKHLKEKTVPTPIAQQPNQSPYWIIVSDDGPSTHPARHGSKTLAKAEALRLTEKYPGKTFTVFEAKTSYLTPRSDTKKTEYVEQNYYRWSFGYGYQPLQPL